MTDPGITFTNREAEIIAGIIGSYIHMQMDALAATQNRLAHGLPQHADGDRHLASVQASAILEAEEIRAKIRGEVSHG